MPVLHFGVPVSHEVGQTLNAKPQENPLKLNVKKVVWNDKQNASMPAKNMQDASINHTSEELIQFIWYCWGVGIARW